MVKTYSYKADGNVRLSDNFSVKEFVCKDYSDKILIDTDLVTLLQKIRNHFGKPVSITSAYRNAAYNKSVGGATNSQHTYGTATDIIISGVTPLEIAQYAEYLLGSKGGIGVYKDFTHVDVRAARSRWDNRSGREIVVSGWSGYVEPEPPKQKEVKPMYNKHWAQEFYDYLISKGMEIHEMRFNDVMTRGEVFKLIALVMGYGN